jgi:hypothetical protein
MLVAALNETRIHPGIGRTCELRFEARTLCRGEIRLLLTEDQLRTEIVGELMDVSDSGFRACYKGDPLLPDSQVQFVHKFFRGNARVVWSRSVAGQLESGFRVVRD